MVVANAARIDADPMNALDQIALQTIPLESMVTDTSGLGHSVFVNEMKHFANLPVSQGKSGKPIVQKNLSY